MRQFETEFNITFLIFKAGYWHVSFGIFLQVSTLQFSATYSESDLLYDSSQLLVFPHGLFVESYIKENFLVDV